MGPEVVALTKGWCGGKQLRSFRKKICLYCERSFSIFSFAEGTPFKTGVSKKGIKFKKGIIQITVEGAWQEIEFKTKRWTATMIYTMYIYLRKFGTWFEGAPLTREAHVLPSPDLAISN